MKTPLATVIVLLAVSFVSSGQTKFENGLSLYHDGKTNQAKSLLLEVVKEDPRRAEAYYYLGMMTIGTDYEQAIDYLQKAIDLADTSARYHLMLGNAYGRKAQKAGIFGKLGAASNCKEQYLAAISLDPKYTDARRSVIEFYLQAPGIVGGSAEKAMAEADTIKMFDPYAGSLAEARVHEYRKEEPQAEQCYRKAISIDRRSPDAYGGLWYLYMGQNNESKADQLLKQALEVVDDQSTLFFWAGQYYVGKNDFPSARRMFETALKKNPGNTSVYYQLGKADLLAGTDLAHGIACLQKFLTAPRTKDAPDPEYAYWRIGMIYEKMGKVDSARIAYRKSLELNPDLEESREALEKLE